MTRVVLIGPVLPYRGGIAHFHTVLANNLRKRHTVKVFSFKRLYPKILYPGEFQKEEKPSQEVQTPIEFTLDSINPFTWIETVKKIKKEKPEYVLFQWWHTFFTPSYWMLARQIKKNTNAKIGLVCHNFLPHDSNRILNLFLIKQLTKHVDYFIALSSSVEKEIQKELPGKKVLRLLEPTYDTALKNTPEITQEIAREKLQCHGNVILFFGFIRPYKGLHYLIQALPSIIKKIPVTLMIAGEFWQDKEKYLQEIKGLEIEKYIQVHDYYIPSNEVQHYFKAADVLVMPYVSSTNSAVLKMSFGFNTPVIATRVGSNEDFIEHEKNGLLVEPENSEALASAVVGFFEKNLEEKFKTAMKEKLKEFEWNQDKERILFNTIEGEK